MFTVGRESRTRNTGLLENNLLSLSYGRIVQKDINTSDGLLPESFETYQIVQPDDIVFRFTDLQNDRRSLRSARVGERGIITSAYLAFTPVGIDPRFFEYQMRGYDVSKVFYGMGGGLRQSLKYDDVRRMPILVPPLAEQVRIAGFLDRETSKIDTLIEKQNALIERLRERRESVVVRGVFGADSRTRDLPTLIGEHLALEPLLAMTPAHWQVLRFKACLRRSEARNDDLAQPMMSLKINGQVAPRAALQQEPDAASLPRYLVVNPDELVGESLNVVAFLMAGVSM